MAKPDFQWDPQKADRNLRRHQVSFDEAATVFEDPIFITAIDEEHSTDEQRYITIGISKTGRLLVVAHTDREGQVRTMSARNATKREAKFYVEAD